MVVAHAVVAPAEIAADQALSDSLDLGGQRQSSNGANL